MRFIHLRETALIILDGDGILLATACHCSMEGTMEGTKAGSANLQSGESPTNPV